MFEKRRWAQPKRNNGIKNRGLRRELRLRSKEIFYEALGQIIGPEVVKRVLESSVKLQKLGDWTLRMSRPPPKGKKRLLAV
jgi:hypothetical protein